MKTLRFDTLVLLLVALGIIQTTSAQTFDSGSDGHMGNLDIPANTVTNIVMPADGIFHYRSITINSGAVVTFRRNPINTPVYLLAQSNVVINGIIDVSGTPPSGINPGVGGPGGFDGGYGGISQKIQGAGKGPGGGRGNNVSANFSYGNALCSPLVGGSGGSGSITDDGAPGLGGGGGGGAILVASSIGINLGNNGAIKSLGSLTSADAGSGCGGAIRLVAPSITGNGTVSVSGQYAVYYGTSQGGRIRIDSFERVPGASLSYGTVNAVSFTRGSQMFTFPTNSGVLEITRIEAAGVVTNVSSTAPAIIGLPAGQNVSNAVVRVVAIGSFYDATNVPISVVVTPDNGSAAAFNSSITLFGGRGSNDVTVTIPSGTVSAIHAWTRQ